ncbi:amino acid adenylation domain-containing protein [Fibrobacter sp. UWH1]|uniref:amino acid adenylation domain-containing protein n=1 Tax=Fibrobacter sp. UWH1 TaxID=1964354 RepID=UPI000B5244FF|nr:amino acid adenylation domain-containing protein [Fibrobacter sp. UWH1]OWV06867.1 hypothetical protein B7992_14685 [Fibrobacter sp. UWH1]
MTNCIHTAVLERAKLIPNAIALVARNSNGSYAELTYGDLFLKVMNVAGMLKSKGFKTKDLIAIVLPKGMNQVIAALAIQSIGAAYVPVGVHQPMERVQKIFEAAHMSGVLTDYDHKEFFKDEKRPVTFIEDSSSFVALDESEIVADENALAYIIFTSGTTGVPKGVMISHKGASNTIRDINARFNVCENDAAMAISELDFDLSVYDLFGILSAGGKLAVLSEETKKEASVWKAIAEEQKITLWNSVPALFEMFCIVMNNMSRVPLRAVLLSGDWIPLSLFDTTNKIWPSIQFTSLGGATEASIWSVIYNVSEIKKEWKSIPYGHALRNQKIRVVDENNKDCPIGTPGELWIGGEGVAEGYLNQPELTAERFPIIDGERWYRTGDKARFMDCVDTEFMGRLDTQIKLGGYRIELGEIENVIKKHKNYVNAVALVTENGAKKEITAAVVPTTNSASQQPSVSLFKKETDKEEILDRKNIVAEFMIRVMSDSMQFDFWNVWLKSNGFMDHNGNIIQKPVFKESEFSRKLLSSENITLLRDVLNKSIPATNLLKNDLFTPEKIMVQSKAYGEFVKTLQEEIKNYPKAKIAFLNGRSGLTIRKFLEETNQPVDVTVFDESTGMLSMARENLAQFKDKCNINFAISDLVAPVQELQSFDFVVDAGFLHTYQNPAEALMLAYLMLKAGGKLYAIDFENFDPIAVISSAVLEDGFKDYSRSRKGTSLLTDSEWESLFKASRFEEATILNTNGFSQVLIAQKEASAPKIPMEELGIYLKQNLVPYMIPARIEVFLKFPLTPNGKLNRKYLTELLKKKAGEESVDENYIGKEEDIACIWKDLLSIPHIDRKANFFEIGGDSLLATRFIEVLLQKYGVKLSLKDFFEHPELDILAQKLSSEMEASENMEEGEI